MHDDIRKFQLEGDVAEASILQTKDRLIDHLERLMRDYGYAPSIDNDPQWDAAFKQDGVYDFSLTVYGVYVGKEKAWATSGVAGGKPVPKYTALSKSN